MQELMSLIGKEVVADGNWRQCGTAGFFGDVKRKNKTARGYCKVRPQPGSKLLFESLMRNQDRGFCTPVEDVTAIDVILENRDAVLAEKDRNDLQDDEIRALRHDVDRLLEELPGHR